MSTSLNLPKPITGILPSVDKYREDVLSQNLEEQDTLLSKTSPPDSARIKSRIGLTIETLAAIVLSILTVVIGLLAWMRVSASPQTDKLPNFSKLYTDCGSNYSTAFAAGCIFDIVAPQWIPPECYNANLSNEHASKIPKPMFFRWPNLTEPISEDPMEISQYERVWTFDEYHTIHCIYILELAALAAAKAFSGHEAVYLNSISTNSKHTKHCTDLLSSNATSPGPVEIRRPGGILRCNVLSPR